MSQQMIRIGNSAQAVSGKETVKWQLYVEAGENNELIKEISIELHPTFKNRIQTLERNTDGNLDYGFISSLFEGWGTFPVAVTIKWNNGETITLQHQLGFSNGGAYTDCEVEAPLPEPSSSLCVTSMLIDEPLATVEEVDIRDECLQRLRAKPFMQPDDPLFKHGRGYRCETASSVPPPKVTWASTQKPRDDHDAPDWLTASEFADTKEVMHAKAQQLAALLRASKKTVVYSGAGISRGAGIGQAARGGDIKTKTVSSTMAQPTPTHYALGALAKAGFIHGWVQQNHDGLPQKAGFPQEDINEIHGSWYDPSNPVVKYSGSLKSEQYPWMVNEAETADLVLVLGTSLGGLNADQVATNPAYRSLKGAALGMCMINLQQTEQDGKATLRLFGKSDMYLEMILRELGIEKINRRPAVYKEEAHVLVPYDKDGKRTTNGDMMWLDLRPGAEIRLTPGHNVQGAQQPMYMHIGADKPLKDRYGNVRKNGPGNGKVMKRDDDTCSFKLCIEGTTMTLGQWWIAAAMRGGPETLPVVNRRPKYQKADAK